MTDGTVARLAGDWRRVAGAARRRAVVAVAAATVLAALHLARRGTLATRAGAVALVAALVVGVLVAWVVRARAWRRPAVVVGRTVGAADAALGAAIGRGLRLVERSRRDPDAGSPELAELHLERLLERIDHAAVAAAAARVAARYGWVMLVAVVAVLALGARPQRLVEGLDVLAAREGVAPVPLAWVEVLQILAHPPEYLHQKDVDLETLALPLLPFGSTVTVRGLPRHDGRALVLTDGVHEVPFVDDAAVGVVARWRLVDGARLRVAARFGDVLVPQDDFIDVQALADDAPVVQVEGAPRRVLLLDEPVVSLAYEARDDHGLREVDLVLRSGTREERRVLSQLDGETRVDRGGYRLRASDPFVRGSYVPVEVSVEGRDNDPLTGPKWGKSAALTLVPPAIGEAEAARLAALYDVRDAVVDAAADRIDHAPSAPRAAAAEHVARERAQHALIAGAIERAVTWSRGGLRLQRVAARILARQGALLEGARKAEERAPAAPAHAKLRVATEGAALLVDGVVRRIGAADAAAVATRMADVADDAASGAEQARAAEQRDRGRARLDGAVAVLEASGAQLGKLGALGHDLGELTVADLRRIRRAVAGDEYGHAELAARDLAARLRRPTPSFAGGKSSGGVDTGQGAPPSGGAHGDEPDEGEPRGGGHDAAELDQLSRDHAAELGALEQALGEGKGKQGTSPGQLGEAASREKQLAERASKLHRPGKEGAAELERAQRAMREAERAMREGDGARAVERQREAQRQLEDARAAAEREGDEAGDEGERGERGEARHDGDDSSSRGDPADHAPIPRADEHEGPDAFRKRVLQGLATPGDPRVRDAVRRYAEGLLR